jgi:UDP-glucose 4-epimerase
VPVAVKAALNGDTMPVYGTNYNTKDGTAERDYTHVYDVARAHINAMNYLEDGNDSDVFNLGAGKPYSVREVISAVEAETGRKIATVDKEDRDGDVTRSWANISKARELLGWEPQFTLEDIIAHAVAWEKKPRR